MESHKAIQLTAWSDLYMWYDTRNRLTNLGVNGSATPIASYAYTLDATGHRLSVSELSGRTVNCGYDNLYRLTSETIAGDATESIER